MGKGAFGGVKVGREIVGITDSKLMLRQPHVVQS